MFIQRVMAVCLLMAGPVFAETLTLPLDQRPQWLERDGIVMAGSWEPLSFRVRRDGAPGYTPTAEQRAAYDREHSPEMVARLKSIGVNFVMMHCYKGGGLKAEKESMADAVKFAQLCRDQGLRVGVYVCSGAFLWELFLPEMPQAEQWVVRGADGKPFLYNSGAAYRYRWNRNHPDAQAFYRKIVRFAVEEIRTDLVHFDNYSTGPGHDANSVERFREHLRGGFTPQQLQEMGVASPDAARPPTKDSPPLLRYAWDNFCCQSLADSYHDMCRFARGLRPDVLVELNPGGVGPQIRPSVDHGRLLQGGEALWDEGSRPGFRDGRLQSHIRTYKVARSMNNMAFCYTTTPLEMAESMAFNRDCLGAICWFEYGELKRRPGLEEPMSSDLAPFVRFYHGRRDLLRGAEVVADVAVLRSFPSQVFADPRHGQLTAKVEDLLIEDRACFQILHEHQLDRLPRYRALILAGCVALTDEQIGKIKAYAQSGGRVCVIGPAATHDGWMKPRAKPGLDDLPASSVVRAAEHDDLLAAIRSACRDSLSLRVAGQPGLCTELTELPGRRLVHYVNYRADGPVADAATRLRLPAGRRVKSVSLVSPEREAPIELPFGEEAGVVTFTTPKVAVYEIAVIDME